MHWRSKSAIIVLLLIPVTPAFAGTEISIGAGPDIGFFDLADGKRQPGLQTRLMLHTGVGENRASFRLDGSYFRFWADGAQNQDYDGIAIFANLVLRLGSPSGAYPYWTLGIGYNEFWDTENPAISGDESPQIVAGTGIGLRLGWGNVEARFELAGTHSGAAAHVPVFVALRF